MSYKIILCCFLFLGCNNKSEHQSTYNKSQDIVISGDGGIEISGTLDYIDDTVLAIVVPGSGPTDRDGNNTQGLTTNSYKQLSDALRIHGISTFRYDKRGIGKSSKVSEVSATIHSFVADLDHIVKYFNKDFNRIHLIGHSEGAIISTLSCQGKESVRSLTLLAGPGKAFDELLLDQLSKFPKLVPLAEQHIQEINSGTELSEVHLLLQSLFRPSIVPFMKSMFVLDPVVELSKVTQPILVVGGNCDLQVPLEHADLLAEGNSNAIVVKITNMGHVLKHLNEDCSNTYKAYSVPDMPIHPVLVQSIADFIKNGK